jgi:hypothetical protein
MRHVRAGTPHDQIGLADVAGARGPR